MRYVCKTINHLLFIFGILLYLPLISHSNETVLIVWLDDSQSNNTFKGLNWNEHNLLLEHMKEKMPEADFKTIFVPVDQAESALNQIDTTIPNGQKISHLLIATHGSYSSKGNSTELMGFGGFNGEGPFGHFKNFLDSLSIKKNIGEHLHIYLNSCSSFCGTDENLKTRTISLSKYLQLKGVKKFSMWGASQFLTSLKSSTDQGDREWKKNVNLTQLKIFAGLTSLLLLAKIAQHNSIISEFDFILHSYYFLLGLTSTTTTSMNILFKNMPEQVDDF